MSLAVSASVLSGDFSPPSGQFEVTCVVGGVSGLTFGRWLLTIDLSPLFFSQISSIKCVTSKEVTTEMSLAVSASVFLGTSHLPLVSSK